MQRLITLIITCGIIYLIFKQLIINIEVPKNPMTAEMNNEKTENIAPSGNFLEKTLSTVLVNTLKTDEGRFFLESLIQPMNKPIAGSGASFKMNGDEFLTSLFKITTFGEGAKGPASCGHIVTVKYQILTVNNILIEEKTVTFPLGSNKQVPGMDAVIVGMKTNQTRHAVIASKYFSRAEKNQGTSFKLNVLLTEIIPNNFIDNSTKIFDDQLSFTIPLLCGGRAIYDAKITNISHNKVIYNSTHTGKKINMHIGDLNYPVIFSHALHNKIPIGTRTVITKGKYLKSYASEFSTIFPDKKEPEDEYYMIEFFNFVNEINPNNG